MKQFLCKTENSQNLRKLWSSKKGILWYVVKFAMCTITAKVTAKESQSEDSDEEGYVISSTDYDEIPVQYLQG